MIKVLAETDLFKIEHDYEHSYLFNKKMNQIVFEDYFYGEPSWGLIDKKNEWAIIAGEQLVLWTADKIKTFTEDDFHDIHSVRLKGENSLEILIDPWSDVSAIWELNIDQFSLKKMRPFNDYCNLRYSENILW